MSKTEISTATTSKVAAKSKQPTKTEQSKKAAKPAKTTSAIDIIAFTITEIKENKVVTISEVASSCNINRQRAARVLKALVASRMLSRTLKKTDKNTSEYAFAVGTHPAFKS